MGKSETKRVTRLLKRHSPGELTGDETARLAREVERGERQFMVVMSADIRKSTFAMKEAIDPLWFAQTISLFVNFAEECVKGQSGWFDKFTGDGFLGYWLIAEDKHTEKNVLRAVRKAIGVSDVLMQLFYEEVVPMLRQNSHNMRGDIGLSIGIDAGPAYLAEVGGDVTIVGEPVVGAVRMVSAARAWECLANVFVGERLYERRGREPSVRGVRRESRATKEYRDAEVYRLVLPVFDSPSGATPSELDDC